MCSFAIMPMRITWLSVPKNRKTEKNRKQKINEGRTRPKS